MKRRCIDWSSAEVDADGTLAVKITGEVDDAWMDALVRTLEWMQGESHGGDWGEITYGPETFRVGGVVENSVTALRQFLDDAVRHANDAAEQSVAAVQDERPATNLGPEAARRMTDQFRS